MAKNKISTGIISKSRQEQIKYWTERAERDFLAGEKDAYEVAQSLKAVYSRAIKEINQKINGFYGKYAGENGLTFEEIQELLNKSELKDFKTYLAECIKYKEENDIPSPQYDLLKLKTKVTRWDELKTQIQFEMDKVAVTTRDNVGELLYNNYEEGYYKAIFNTEQFRGYAKSFNGLNKPAIERAVNANYLGANYSKRIWQNQSSLIVTLNQEIPRGIVLGYNPRKLAEQVVNKKITTNYNNTVRLIRTEYSKIFNEATMKGYKASKVDQYQILAALDERMCEDCETLDGLIFPISESNVGVNYPPFHPNCRCTTIPYFEPDEIDEMSDEELGEIGFITYDDWKDGLVKLEGDKVIYSPKAKIEK